MDSDSHVKAIIESKDRQREKRDSLLARLENIIIDDPKSIPVLAKEIGISVPALTNFVKANRHSNMVTMAKIEGYVIEKEAQ